MVTAVGSPSRVTLMPLFTRVDYAFQVGPATFSPQAAQANGHTRRTLGRLTARQWGPRPH